MRDYANATLWGNQLETLFQSGDIEDPYLKAVFKSYYGDTRVMTDGIDVSLAQYRQAAPFFEQVDPIKARAEHVMFLANNLGYFLHYKGEIDEANQCLERAKVLLGAQKDIFPQSAIDELEITLNIDAGRFGQAVHVADRELTMLDTDPVFKKVTGHFVESLKACALLKQAQFEALNNNEKEAKALRVQALKVAKDAHEHAVESSDGSADTAVVGRTLLYLSQAQSALGHAKEAQENAQKALKIFAGHYPSEMAHPRQAVAHIALGDALSAQGKHEKAKDAYLKAEAIFDAITTKKAFDDMSEVWARLVDNAIVRGDANTARRCLAAHKETFDGLHPRYIMMAAKVASV
ncbi:MAG: hypothetical protein C0514_08450 [Candidatus Puniceispirillum sp.]|nr:hypothetical protein [Candidatus Puniceispirillum sp.]